MRPWRLLAPRSLRARLTLRLGLVTGLVLIAFTVAVYSLLARSLSAEVDRSLADRAQQVNNAVRLGPIFPPGRGIRIEIPQPDRFASADTFVQLVTLEGEVVGTSQNLGGATLVVTSEDLARADDGQEQYRVARIDGERVRVLTTPLTVRGQTVGMILVARSLERLDSALGRLRWLAGAGLAAALGLAAVVVWLTTRAALRPLEHVVDTANAIGTSDDLGRRVDTPSSEDEVGRLAATFNRMLNRLEGSAASLRAAYQGLEAALAAQRRFVADASHELRTPLTTIRSNASLLRQYPEVTPEDRTAALTQIGEEAERMSRMVHSLLTLARADSGLPLARTPVALGPLVEDAAGQARLLSDGRHAIDVDIASAGEVDGNADALRQLVLILLDNAIKYTPQGGDVSVRLDEEDDSVRLVVADTGPGIDPDDLPHVFERFYRADRSRTAGGTGLGLSIADWIVDQHDGAIEAAGSPGNGSTFTVRLPRLATPDPADE